MAATTAWQFLREKLKPDPVTASLLPSIVPLGFAEGLLYLGAPSSYAQQWLADRLLEPLGQEARGLGLAGVRVVGQGEV